MITNITLSESHNLDLLDSAALDAFDKAAQPKLPQPLPAADPAPARPDEKLTDGLVSAASLRDAFLQPVFDEAAAVPVTDKVDVIAAVDPVELEPVKLPTNFTEYWAVTERPTTFTAAVYLLKATVAPVSFATSLLSNLTLSMTRMVSSLFRPTMKPTPDVGEALLEQIAAQRKDDAHQLQRIREEIITDVATAERKA